MVFGYDYYYEYCYIFPLRKMLPFSLFMIIGVSIEMLIWYIVAKRKGNDYSDYRMGYVLIVGIASFFLLQSIGCLANGGFYLKTEKETDAVEITGTITKVKMLSIFAMPNVGSQYDTGVPNKNGFCFTVDGIRIKSFGKGDFEVGDRVTVVYLPKSGYLLSITKLTEDSDSSPP